MDGDTDITAMKKRLVDLILSRSFRFSERPIFRLASGRMSSFYFNCKPVTLSSEGMFLIGNLLYELIRSRKTWKIKAVGGLTLGADPIACAIAYTAHLRGDSLEALVVRKESKKHGTMAWIEGWLEKGDRVVIIEDVVTTGDSAIKAVTRARECGLRVIAVVALIDRQEGGRAAIKAMGIPFRALLTKEEIFSAYKERMR